MDLYAFGELMKTDKKDLVFESAINNGEKPAHGNHSNPRVEPQGDPERWVE